MAKRALVIGSDGSIGASLAAALRARGDQVIGTTRRHAPAAAGHAMFLDLAAPDLQSVDLPSVDVAFLCAAMTRMAECRASPEMADRINHIAPVALSAKLASRGARVIFLSTGAVLDGRAPRMAAERPRLGRSAYGRSKAVAELGILGQGSTGTILRLTKVLLPAMPLFVGWATALRQRRPIEAYEDHHIAPIGLDHAVDALVALGDKGAGGVYQASGACDVSYFDLAKRLAARVGAPTDLVRRASAAEQGVPEEEIAAFSSLDTSRLTDLTGFVPPDPYDLLDRSIGLPGGLVEPGGIEPPTS